MERYTCIYSPEKRKVQYMFFSLCPYTLQDEQISQLNNCFWSFVDENSSQTIRIKFTLFDEFQCISSTSDHPLRPKIWVETLLLGNGMDTSGRIRGEVSLDFTITYPFNDERIIEVGKHFWWPVSVVLAVNWWKKKTSLVLPGSINRVWGEKYKLPNCVTK